MTAKRLRTRLQRRGDRDPVRQTLLELYAAGWVEQRLLFRCLLRGSEAARLHRLSNAQAETNLGLKPTEARSVAEFLAAKRKSNSTVAKLLGEILPVRVAEHLAQQKKLTETSDAEIERIAANVSSWKVKFSRSEGYDRAEVTLGGVSTGELSSKTMGSKKVPGLFFIGEVVDVTGWLGGYNFQWAWSSAHAAAKAI